MAAVDQQRRPGSVASDSWQSRATRPVALLVLVLLLVQFQLGTTVNLFVSIDKSHPGARPGDYLSGSLQGLAWAVTGGGPWLALHVVFGGLLGLASVAWLALAIASRRRSLIVLGVIGLLSVLGAGLNGVNYLDFADDTNSFAMAFDYALATLVYVICVAIRT